MTDWTPTRIRDLRERLGLTCWEFGALLGVAGTTVSRWESGQAVNRRTELALDALDREGK